MTTAAPDPTRRRRRGAELEAALLDAAWDELIEAGFAKLTMESVASRAGTGVAVLYRRWANKDEVVLAALERYRNAHLVDIPDTGSLRGDLVAVLTTMGEARSVFFAIAAATAFSGLLVDTGMTPTQVRDRIMGDKRLSRMRSVYERAHDRGEIDLESIPPALLAMPFDLVRHDLVMDLKPLEPRRIESIVDELFLPLVRHYGRDGGGSSPAGGAPGAAGVA
ncbi:putative TetR family transcriptional regulator [Actinacidiphila reveromycinica]|uniref:Putative TetR family transcriptional regulator n=1 Tax=Actinacidiphila reveromycinica TaxID=659352 RepID=A0A7U3UYD7_9ACTN|nr:TetR/AcrR family transcriptional regulator [Streptomyces sp. SN-593]BBB00995.1 putative TetR family transcriptional regulator [Streptomyces sp. SN-593]